MLTSRKSSLVKTYPSSSHNKIAQSFGWLRGIGITMHFFFCFNLKKKGMGQFLSCKLLLKGGKNEDCGLEIGKLRCIISAILVQYYLSFSKEAVPASSLWTCSRSSLSLTFLFSQGLGAGL